MFAPLRAVLTKARVLAPSTPTRSLSSDVAGLNARMGAQGTSATNASVQMGPGAAPSPTPLDDTGQPRQYPYRVGWNVPSIPGEGKKVSFATLRELVRTYDLLGKAINIRADEISSLRFDIVARDSDRKQARETVKKRQDDISLIRDFFAYPDGRQTWQTWVHKLLIDHFTFDAVAIYKHRTLGGKLKSLRLLDGSTIKPLLSVLGDTPEPPDPAYQQYLFGAARFDFDTTEMIYAVKNPQLDSPYGIGPVEQFMWHVNEALRYGRARTDYFTDGTLPEGVAIAPPGTDARQLVELREWWDGIMSGDSRQLHKLQWVPNATTFHIFKPFEFSEPYALWLVELTALSLDVTPQQLGFQPRSAGLGGKGFAEEQTSIQRRKAINPLTRWILDEIINPIIWREFGVTDLQGIFIDDGDEEDKLAKATTRDMLIRSGQMSIDQAVEEDGGTPPGIGRMFTVGNNILFEPDLIAGSRAGAASIPSKELDTPGIGEKPPAAPKAGKPGTQDIIGVGTEPSADDAAAARSRAANKATEIGTFLSFVQKRRLSGKWRDFESVVIPGDELRLLNKAARSGASSQELRVMIGMDHQPHEFQQRLATTERQYQGYTSSLAKKVAEEIDRERKAG